MPELPPFSKDRIEEFNKDQKNPRYHPYTCCSPGDIPECTRTKGTSEGILIAHKDGMTCPCGKYTRKLMH